MTSQQKPHKGQIKDWFKLAFNREITEKHYGESAGLGFAIIGTFIDHPQFGYSPGGRTSWIVAMSEPDDQGNTEVETRNSRYTLVGPGVVFSDAEAAVQEQTGKLAD